MSDLAKEPLPRAFSELEVRTNVRALVLRHSPAPPQRTDAIELIRDFAFHSLALLELAFTVEEEFGLRLIDESTARGIRTISDLEDHVLRELRETGRLT